MAGSEQIYRVVSNGKILFQSLVSLLLRNAASLASDVIFNPARLNKRRNAPKIRRPTRDSWLSCRPFNVSFFTSCGSNLVLVLH